MGVVRNQSVKNSISFYIGMAIGAINTVIIYPNVFKENPEHFGLIQILLAYAIVVSTITTFGIPKTFVRFFPAIKEKGELYFLSFLTPLIGFLFALVSYFIFKEQLFDVLNSSELLSGSFGYIILLVFFIGFYDVLTAVSRSFLSAVTPIFINEVFLKFYSMSVLLLHWYGYFDFSTFLKIYFFGYILKFLILLFIQFMKDRLFFSFSFKYLNVKEMLRYGLYVLLAGASMIIVTRLDVMMLGSLLDLEQVAYYTVAFFIGNAIMVPSKSISAISIPLIAKAWEKNDLNEIQELYQKSSINQLIIGGVFFLCVWINIDSIFSLLPENFQGGKWVVFYIGIAQLFNLATGVNGAIIINSSFYKFDLYTSIFLVFITILANYIFIPIYKIDGAAIATAISIFLFNFIRLVIIQKKLNMHPFNWQTLYTVLLLFITYFILILLPDSSYHLLDIIWKSFTIFIIFIPLALYFKLSDDINLFIKDLKSRFLD